MHLHDLSFHILSMWVRCVLYHAIRMFMPPRQCWRVLLGWSCMRAWQHKHLCSLGIFRRRPVSEGHSGGPSSYTVQWRGEKINKFIRLDDWKTRYRGDVDRKASEWQDLVKNHDREIDADLSKLNSESFMCWNKNTRLVTIHDHLFGPTISSRHMLIYTAGTLF